MRDWCGDGETRAKATAFDALTRPFAEIFESASVSFGPSIFEREPGYGPTTSRQRAREFRSVRRLTSETQISSAAEHEITFRDSVRKESLRIITNDREKNEYLRR